MTTPARATQEISGYHAHIYYDAATTRGTAARLRAQIEERFAVRMGRWHDNAIGPHLQSMYQVAFENAVFPALVPFLMLNHGGLSILIHPNTNDARRDHLDDSLWIGPRVALNEDALTEAATPA